MVKELSLDTLVVSSNNNDQHNASVAPLYQTTTFKQKSVSDLGEYDYTRSGNPTRTQLESQLSIIMKAEKTFAVTSGMGCLDVITRLLKPGDEVIAGDDLYGGTHRLLTFLNKTGAIKLKIIDTTNPQLVKSTLSQNTKMIFLESPTNPLIKVIDLPKISEFLKTNYPNCISVFDNTMMSPLLLSPLKYVDIQYESATKYLNGHHDIMAGVIATNSKKLSQDLFFIINATGCGLAPFDSWLLLRGLKTLSIRFERQQSNAIKLTNWLESLGFKVNYPGLKSHPQYQVHNSYNKGFGAVFSFETKSIKTSERIVEGTKLFGVTVSFGAVNSLISMPCRMSHASIDPETRAEREFPEDLIRVCVGIEDSDDLIEDLKQSLLNSGAIREINGKLIRSDLSKL
ncbi:Cystathionine gamma-lyase [Wickerhamomyces ciferrii]|uniref:Cystathionine beta-lyase n=1 Tax=Wickerhamomyces ciferrii (strain ATCC 14091 / BCRC 22168 / CBS 111 / JCM 3599 / NBRC 0793 / NRRL Y-1031 F-60-10) TaxID=1206466 RepID=K0K7L2_WICCF|nr:Cystathionine gamma-lyase [Wickerhamomyces ciferrii]CCH40795.1 Cystathionine gamma-lyase [Wickerhamomyces ciferrii]